MTVKVSGKCLMIYSVNDPQIIKNKSKNVFYFCVSSSMKGIGVCNDAM